MVDHADVAIPWLSPLYVNKPKITIVHQLVKEIYYYQLTRPWADICAQAERIVYRLYSSSLIVASSPNTARELIELGIPACRISTIIPGHDFHPGGGLPLDERDMTIACVSRLVRYKGIQFALRAFRDVLPEHPEATFKIAGTGPYESSLREITNSLGIKQHVEFLGRISEKAKFELLSRSRAAVFPSVRDGFGITVMEANSVGTPVVGWKVPGPSDSVIDGTTGLLAAFPDESAFARNLVTLLGNDPVWKHLSSNALTMSSNVSWDASARHFEEIIGSLPYHNHHDWQPESSRTATMCRDSP